MSPGFHVSHPKGAFQQPTSKLSPYFRTTTTWEEGVLLRIHTRLDDIDDLKADLAEAFGRLAANS